MKRGQSRGRAMRRGNINQLGQSLRRPFNNRKRTKGREAQVNGQKYFRYLKERLAELQKLNLEAEDESNNIDEVV